MKPHAKDPILRLAASKAQSFSILQHLAKHPERSVMMRSLSGMAESDGGSVETAVRPIRRTPVTLDRLAEGLNWRCFIAFIRWPVPSGSSLPKGPSLNGCASEVSSDYRLSTFNARDRFRARPCPGHSGMAPAQFNPECALRGARWRSTALRTQFQPAAFSRGAVIRPQCGFCLRSCPRSPCREFNMANKMLIDASHPEETRVVVVRGQKVEEFDFESANRKQLRGNIYLAKVTRVEPSLQAAFVEYGGNRHGFLAFSEIHPITTRSRSPTVRLCSKRGRGSAEEEREEERRRHRRRRSAPARPRPTSPSPRPPSPARARARMPRRSRPSRGLRGGPRRRLGRSARSRRRLRRDDRRRRRGTRRRRGGPGLLRA